MTAHRLQRVPLGSAGREEGLADSARQVRLDKVAVAVVVEGIRQADNRYKWEEEAREGRRAGGGNESGIFRGFIYLG